MVGRRWLLARTSRLPPRVPCSRTPAQAAPIHGRCGASAVCSPELIRGHAANTARASTGRKGSRDGESLESEKSRLQGKSEGMCI